MKANTCDNQEIGSRFHTCLNENKLAAQPISVRHEVADSEEAIAWHRAKIDAIELQLKGIPWASGAYDALQSQISHHRDVIKRLWTKVAPFQIHQNAGPV